MVTIGMPVYNGERWFLESIKSILRQTYSDWELIVIDDGSGEELGIRSEELCCDAPREQARREDWAEKITVIRDGKHLGIAARLNQMIAMARGEYFARMDVDDIMMPTRLEKQVSFLQDHPEADVVSCSAIVINEQSEELGVRSEKLMHPTVIGRTEWFRQNPYNEAYSGVEDYELWLRVKGKAKILHLNEPLMYYRERTRYNVRKVWRERALGIRMIWNERHLYGSAWRALLQIANNVAVMMAVPIIHAIHLDKWVILRRNA